MKLTLDPNPVLPPEVENAAKEGELVVFVGAGVSKLIDCPSWDEFASLVLKQLAPKGINYYNLNQIERIVDPKKRLSLAQIVAKKTKIEIDYSTIFKKPLEKVNVYTYLNSFKSAFVTTNYDTYLCPESRKAEPESNWRCSKREQLLRVNLDRPGNVVHLHGCVDDPSTMVISTRDYLDHYSTEEVREFLGHLFKKKTVLFLGYGLEETEILEHILKRGDVSRGDRSHFRRFILQGFFHAETDLCNLLREFYRESFYTDLIGFPKDDNSYAHLTEIIARWSSALRFEKMALTDEAAALEDEISG
ncbi:MAG: SIR2 family protein [Nitrospira sp.]|nr:SIR2 family protein [Nitrospira sp.]